MRHVIAFVFLCLPACGLLSSAPTDPDAPVDWPDVVACGPGIDDIVATVSRILLGAGGPSDTEIPDRAKAELEDLAREHGADTVACMIELVRRQWLSPGAAQNPDRAAAAARGEDFLDDVGVTIEEAP